MPKAEKLDLYKAHKSETVTPKKPVLLDIGPAKYLAIDGEGEPGGGRFKPGWEPSTAPPSPSR
jgi:hypothetical protein